MKLLRPLIAGLYGIENSGVRHLVSMLRERGGFRADMLFFKDWRNNQVDWPTDTEVELLLDLIRREGYDLVGLSFGSPYFKIAIDITRRIKQAFGDRVFVLWGGIHATLVPEECIPHCDGLIRGEGEHPLLDLVQRLEDGVPLDGVSGLWLNKPDGTCVKNPIRDLITDLDSLPFRHFGGDCVYLIDRDQLSRGDPMLRHTEYRIYCSRGCPYKCAYCYNSSLRAIYPEGKGNYHRRRTVTSVMAELRWARQFMPGLRWVKFDDDTFVFPRPWLDEFCAAYGAEFSDLPFDILITPDVVRYDQLKMLKAVGLRGVQLGIEAGSDREQQEVYERTTTVQQILDFDRMNLDLKLDTKFDVIIDNPLAISSDKEALFHLLLDLQSDYKIYLYSLTLFPKSKVTEKIIAAGLATRWDVEGWATKSFHQFRVDIDWPRPDEDTFYLALYMLASKRFVPRKLLRDVHASAFWRAHPRALLEIAQGVNLVRMSGIAASMLWRGELSWQKVREYGNLRKMLNQ